MISLAKGIISVRRKPALLPNWMLTRLDDWNISNIMIKIKVVNLLVGHFLISHASVSWPFPGHSPPYCGAGLLHSLVLTLFPVPQVALHTDHSSQSPHLPGTLKNYNDYRIG